MEKFSIKAIIILFVTLASLFLNTGCSGSSSGSDSSETADNGSDSGDDNGGGGTVTLTISSPSESALFLIGENLETRTISVTGTCTANSTVQFSLPSGMSVASSSCNSSGVLSASIQVDVGVSGSKTINATIGSTSVSRNISLSACPVNYVLVPANSSLGTSAFCLAKYEAKAETNAGADVLDAYTLALDAAAHVVESRSSGVPWVRINIATARTECSNIGTGYALVTLSQWQAAARNIENVGSNWSSGTVGTGAIFKNHSDNTVSASAITDGLSVSGTKLLAAGDGSDPYVGTGNSSSDSFGSGLEQRRTFILSNNEVVWDMAGNAREFVDIDGQGSSVSFTGGGSNGFFEFSSATFSGMVSSSSISAGGALSLSMFQPTNGSFTSAHNMGRIYIESGARTGRYVTRGGNFATGNADGLFGGDLDSTSNYTGSSAGFRCVFNP